PNAGLTTNIGATHLEFFGDEQRVFEEEAYLYDAVRYNTDDQGFFLINKDDSCLRTLADTKGTMSFSSTAEAQVLISFLDDGAKIILDGKEIVLHNKHITGKHNKLNLAVSTIVANHFYSEKRDDILEAASHFLPTKNRSQWITFLGR